MSFSHLRLRKTNETEVEAMYIVESPDFGADYVWEEIGEITIDKVNGSYEFERCGVWAEENAVPPNIFALSEQEIKKRLKNEFRGYGYGAWARKIHRLANVIIRENKYPSSF